MSKKIMVIMRLPQHQGRYTNEELYKLLRRRVFAKSNFKDPLKSAPVLILNLNDGARNYQMGVPIERGSFMAMAETTDKGLEEFFFEARLDGNILGNKWRLVVHKNGQAYLEKLTNPRKKKE